MSRTDRAALLVAGLAGVSCASTTSVGFLSNGEAGWLLFGSSYADDRLEVQVSRRECFEGCGAFGDCGSWCSDVEGLGWDGATVQVEPEQDDVRTRIGGDPVQIDPPVTRLIIELSPSGPPLRFEVTLDGREDVWTWTGD